MQDLVNYLESWLKDRKIDMLSGNKVNAFHIFNLLNSKNGARIIGLCFIYIYRKANKFNCKYSILLIIRLHSD